MNLAIRRAVVTALITLPALGTLLYAGGRAAAGPYSTPSTLDPQPASRKFSFFYTAKIAPTPDAKEKLRVWIPVPQSNTYQDISDVEITGPVKHALKRDGFYHNEFAYFDVPAADVQKGFAITLRFHAVRREHRVALDAPPALALHTHEEQRGDRIEYHVTVDAQPSASADPPTPAELKRYLEPDKLVPLTGTIGELSAEQTKGLTDPLAKARAVYTYVVSTMKYDKTGTGWGRGDAAWFCTAKKGNCTDFHGMFIGMARAAGIPARFEIGFPLPAKAGEGTIGGYHCWAEFYVKGYGWIPVDASEAWKNPEKRDYFFGAHDVNRVQFTIGRDVELAPRQAGPPVNYSVYPYAELGGKPLSGIQTEFAFKDIQ